MPSIAQKCFDGQIYNRLLELSVGQLPDNQEMCQSSDQCWACSGIVGMGLVAYGTDAVVWYKYNTELVFPIQGITAVVLSWLVSPLASGFVAAFFFWVARTLVLRAADSYQRAFYFLPVLVGVTTFVNAFYVLDKAISKQWKWLKEKGGTGASAWIAVIIGVACMIGGIAFAFWLKKKIDVQIKEGTLSANAAPKDTGAPGSPTLLPSPLGSQMYGVCLLVPFFVHVYYTLYCHTSAAIPIVAEL